MIKTTILFILFLFLKKKTSPADDADEFIVLINFGFYSYIFWNKEKKGIIKFFFQQPKKFGIFIFDGCKFLINWTIIDSNQKDFHVKAKCLEKIALTVF